MPTYRPRVIVNLKLKFDESLTTFAEKGEPPDPTITVDGEVSTQRSPRPLVASPGPRNVSFVLNRVPRSAKITKPGFRQAGKWTVDLAFRDLPIDPRTVSAAAVEIHQGTISAADMARAHRPGGDPSYGFLRTRNPDGSPNETTLAMLGVVDEWSVSHSDQSLVTVVGRDLRGGLLDQGILAQGDKRANVLDAIDLNQPIDAVVLQILSFYPNDRYGAVNVIVNPEDWPGSTVPIVAAAELVARHQKGAKGKRKAAPAATKAAATDNGLKFWDLIVQFCFMVGAVPFFTGVGDLIIRPAHSLYDKLRGPVDPERNPTPFAGGKPRLVDAVTGTALQSGLKVRRMVYGRDTSSVEYRRRYAGRKRYIVRVIGFDPSAPADERVRVGIWPPQAEQAAQTTGTNPGAGKKKADAITVPAPQGLRDIGRLTEVARSLYEEIGRGELGGSVRAKNLASFGGDNADPDLLRLNPGDAVELLTNTRANRVHGAPLVSSVTDHYRNSFAEQVELVRKQLGGDETLARVIVATSRGQITELQSFFRVSSVEYSWTDKGVDISFDFHNFVTAIAEVGDTSAVAGEATVGSTEGITVSDPGAASITDVGN